MRNSIKEWVKKYCAIHRFTISKPNKKPHPYLSVMSHRMEKCPFGYFDDITKAFNWIKEQQDEYSSNQTT